LNRYQNVIKIQFLNNKVNRLYLFNIYICYSNMKIIINGIEKEFDGNSLTANELVKHLQLEGKRFAIERNGEILPKGLFAELSINEGDRLEIVGAVGGG